MTDDDFEAHRKQSRRAVFGLASGAGLALVNFFVLSDQLPYFTATPQPFVAAAYLAALILLAFGAHAFVRARELRATSRRP